MSTPVQQQQPIVCSNKQIHTPQGPAEDLPVELALVLPNFRGLEQCMFMCGFGSDVANNTLDFQHPTQLTHIISYYTSATFVPPYIYMYTYINTFTGGWCVCLSVRN